MKKHTQSPYESSEISYKPSGIKWLGEIPQSWKNVSIRSCFTESNQRCNTDSYPLLSVTIANGIIYQDDIENKKDISNDDKSNYKIVPLNAVAYNKMRMWQGAVGVNTLTIGIVSPAYIVAIPNEKILPNFVSYLFKSKIMISEFDKNSYGLCLDMNNLRYDDFRNIKIPLPPLQEQKEIAEFLDEKCEKIQNYIDKKQKLITLLQEKKQALINEAVCGRVACHTERSEVSTTAYKPSGIEYLGLIPHHWEVKKLKYVGKVVLGKMLCNEHQKGYSHCYYLKSKNLQWLNVEVSQIEKMWFSEYEKSLYRIKKDDLLVSEGGEVGKTCIWNNELAECYIQNSVHKITLNKFNNAKFFLYLFFTYGKLGVFDSVVSRVSIAHLVLEKLVNVDMVVPPLQEQKQIANFLDKKCEKINSAIEKTKRQIKLIKEYKNTLINEAVCGRINLQKKERI
ncbi:restriction endonuclease subunit S [Campylobacter upsaliensis]|uniref:restriction endonuclease subunit S n=1 Tax=Campylobacter upsaliensis TaxID=28080 RepID=UPI0012871CC5|nr:restriction endonuclease subunit S [Campylobacter upsaliensis]EAI7244883.1 restriction endonuclease subunit S [Campylobacter upsaliensis]EAK0449538.1 restriction endonuclease subunit S [Campylobacter upsaliensis]EAK1131457.1 restriction endonuclease subunit S [Campylobacter upsaliensis]EAK2459747.1 restriction endonuclease subunit S [Campylobacter upsaliensis]EGK8047346.1 restriction endonuclease subunit S [Campylobacter upsaliensis]